MSEERDARILKADRKQLQMRTYDLDAALPAEHRARLIWAFMEKLDLSRFYDKIDARGSEPGRSAIDPRILLALWLFATSEGVGSAREIDRLCERDDAYRWICGGVAVNYHRIADFRVENGKELDELMTQVLGVLLHQGLVQDLTRVAQDGMRVRASAGAASFHRKKSLEACLVEASQQVERVKREAEQPDPKRSAREQAAAERAAKEREARLQAALEELPKAAASKPAKERDDARVSTTDSEARVMKMGDGGFRPAYNVQFATDTKSRVIVGVGVTNAGSDMGQLEPMLEEIERRSGKLPREYLVDGGFTKLSAIEEADRKGVTVYAPVQKPKLEGIDPYARKDTDTDRTAAWRARMGTDAAKAIYKERAATAETVNADLRIHRGLDRLRVRGSGKVLSVTLWMAITYNILRWISLAGAGATA